MLRLTDHHLRERGIVVLADYRAPTARPAWLRIGGKASFMNGRGECDGVIQFIDDRSGKAGVRITAPALLAGTLSVQRFADLIDADCPPAEDEYPEGGAA